SGHRVAEVPSTWIERSAGISKFRIARWMPYYLRWYLPAIAAGGAVWLGWVALCAWAAWFISSFCPNLPYWDEWANIPYLTGEQPITLEWLWSPHGDHRIPLARVVYLGAAVLAGRDTRGPMAANAVLLALAAAMVILVFRRIRGRNIFTDLTIPFVIFGIGNYVTLLEGFQLAFALTVL